MVQTLSAQEVREKLHSDADVVVIDVLSRGHFRKQHLPKAINIPVDDIAEHAEHILGKQREIIVYCYDKDCGASPKAAEILEENGYENVSDLEVGIEGYKQTGFNVITYD